ncbi:HlyD family efflux transporter periplasmic adaptor subunit [Filomicrobium sp.]|uniref:efflux RND transporter periplasmic adaptor subunit n=1 Tax=Filomicrobium sp. TaxID=2024831 RepID=UPI00258831B7|nr:HlyD family efflux transporter periplasmic adaptor subunit [Filomicrobium sp.]MCV0371466.1 HlyD family efflux transporter periplasmic adaptor subunit [Filomicrobium sp.]
MHWLFAVILWAFTLAHPVLAGPGHDHGHDHGAQSEIAAPEIPRLQSSSSDLELVATAEGHTLTIYLDRFATNEPVEGATIEVSGDSIPTVTASPVGEGVYEIEGEWLDHPGTYALIFMVSAGDTMDLLNGTLDILGPEAPKQDAANSWSDLLAQPMVWAIGGLAALFGFFFSFAFRPARLPGEPAASAVPHSDTVAKQGSKAAAAVLVAIVSVLAQASDVHAGPGHDHGEPAATPTGGNAPRKLPDGTVFVPKNSQRLLRVRTTVTEITDAAEGRELIGVVISEPSASGHVQAPMDGQIELTDRGIAFVGQRVGRGEVLAMLSPTIPVADRGSLQQLTAEVEGKLRIAEQKLARLTRIAGVVAQREIEDTQTELEALREQQRVLAPKSAEKLKLTAPVAGVISIANVKAGQVVSARDTLFEIVDPQRLWVEAIGIGGHDEMKIQAAYAIDAEGHSIALSYVGRSPTLRQQSLPILFKVEDTHEALTIGSTLRVIMQGEKEARGIVLPQAAVVRALNGMAQVWVKVAPEKFEPITVTTIALDGSRVLVSKGLDAESRVVVEGSELINQIR